MSRFDRVVGLARSLAIYHAIPMRQRRLRQFYAQFVGPDDLVFDIGSHAGNRLRAFAGLGCRVVAVEPQPDFARLLRTLFARSSGIEVVEAAVSDAAGRASLLISDRRPAVTTIARPWRDARARDPDFVDVRWNRSVEVETTTLDLLIARFGVPAFIKIDVEGSEPAVLGGLSHAVPALSLEYLPHALDQLDLCITRLKALGPYRFNWSRGESYRLAASAWLSDQELAANFSAPGALGRFGDLYARLVRSA